MRYAYLLLVVLAMLCVAAVSCPTDTPPAVPTATYHPTRTPSPTETVKPTDTVGVTPYASTPAATGIASVPERDKHPAETLPVTGAGDSMSLGMVAVLGVVLLSIAFLARMVRRGTH